MIYEEIKQKFSGMWGVYTHDMYKCSKEECANGFIAAFDKFIDALKCAKESENRVIHIVLCPKKQ